MAVSNKDKNTTQQVKGRVKETVGVAVGDRDLENEGRLDQFTANLNQAGDKLVDAGKKLMKALRV